MNLHLKSLFRIKGTSGPLEVLLLLPLPTSSAELGVPFCRTKLTLAERNGKLAKFESAFAKKVDEVGIDNLDLNTRGLVVPFLAWRLAEEPGLHAIDRQYWTEYYNARQLLQAGKAREAKHEADIWLTCLRSLDRRALKLRSRRRVASPVKKSRRQCIQDPSDGSTGLIGSV